MPNPEYMPASQVPMSPQGYELPANYVNFVNPVYMYNGSQPYQDGNIMYSAYVEEPQQVAQVEQQVEQQVVQTEMPQLEYETDSQFGYSDTAQNTYNSQTYNQGWGEANAVYCEDELVGMGGRTEPVATEDCMGWWYDHPNDREDVVSGDPFLTVLLGQQPPSKKRKASHEYLTNGLDSSIHDAKYSAPDGLSGNLYDRRTEEYTPDQYKRDFYSVANNQFSPVEESSSVESSNGRQEDRNCDKKCDKNCDSTSHKNCVESRCTCEESRLAPFTPKRFPSYEDSVYVNA
eukprot:Platyproteum_vivax@DN6012_c0_g1_i1.p1